MRHHRWRLDETHSLHSGEANNLMSASMFALLSGLGIPQSFRHQPGLTSALQSPTALAAAAPKSQRCLINLIFHKAFVFRNT